jgi:hypothetical protein
MTLFLVANPALACGYNIAQPLLWSQTHKHKKAMHEQTAASLRRI